MIADNYQCEINDITSNNLHITDFKNLKAGMKIKIPLLSKPIMDVLEETESFISDYYPNLSEQIKEGFSKKAEETKIEGDINVEEIADDIKEENRKQFSSDIKQSIQSKFNDNQQIQSMYKGNVTPNIPREFIKKI